MIVTTKFPDLPPLPETPRNAEFRRRFFSRWGRENSVFVASARRAAYGPIPTALSFKTVLQGEVALTLGRRPLKLEPGRFLMVNPGDTYRVDINSPREVQCFSVHFQPALAGEVASSHPLGWRAALASGPLAGREPWLRESLRPLDPGLQRMVQLLAASVAAGQPDAMALEQQFITLLQLLLDHESQRLKRDLDALDSVRVSTRQELLRRVDWAADFIHSSYAEAITLADIAQAAHLSKFHLLRAFHQVKHCTPHQYLRACRVAAARRLLKDPALDLEAVATAAGFGSRWTLQRALRLHLGASGAFLRGAGHA